MTNKFKKIAFFVVPVAVLAMSGVVCFAQVNQTNAPTEKNLSEWLDVVNSLARWVYTILLIVAVFFGLMAAFNFMTSGGDQAKVKKASSQLIYAIVAIVVAVLAFSIKSIALNLVGQS